MVFSKTSWEKKWDSYLFLVLEVIAPMVCLTPIEVKFRPLSVKGSVSKLIGFVRVALLIGWVGDCSTIFHRRMTLQLSQVQLAAVISYDFSLNWRSNYRKRNSVHGFDRLRFGVMF